MIDDMLNLQYRRIEEINVNNLFPLLRWSSGSESNLSVCRIVNRDFFFVDKEILLSVLALGIQPKIANNKGQFFVPIRYPKPAKFDKTKYDIVASYIQKYYCFGKNDMGCLKKIIENLIDDKEKIAEFANNFGLDNSERKALGVTKLEFDKSKMKERKGLDLFNL